MARDDIFSEYRDVPRPGPEGRKAAPPAAPARPNFAAKLFGILAGLSFLFTFLMGFLGSAMLPAGHEWILAAGFGCIFLFAGLAISAGSGTKGALLFSLAGGCVTGFSLAYGLSGDAWKAALMERVIPAALLSVFVIAGAGLAIVPGRLEASRAKAHPVAVTATVAGKRRRRSTDSDGHSSYSYVLDWTYYVHGREYRYTSRIGRGREPREPGDSGTLYVAENDPKDVWEPMDRSVCVLLAVVGAAFLAAGVFALFILLAL